MSSIMSNSNPTSGYRGDSGDIASIWELWRPWNDSNARPTPGQSAYSGSEKAVCLRKTLHSNWAAWRFRIQDSAETSPPQTSDASLASNLENLLQFWLLRSSSSVCATAFRIAPLPLWTSSPGQLIAIGHPIRVTALTLFLLQKVA